MLNTLFKPASSFVLRPIPSKHSPSLSLNSLRIPPRTTTTKTPKFIPNASRFLSTTVNNLKQGSSSPPPSPSPSSSSPPLQSEQLPPAPIQAKLKRGQSITCTVRSFGPLGASVTITFPSKPIDSPDSPAEPSPVIATGLILQKEIQWYRSENLNTFYDDILVNDVIEGFVMRVHPAGTLRDVDEGSIDEVLGYNSEGSMVKVDVSLRSISYGTIDEAIQGIEVLLKHESGSNGLEFGVLEIGDRSSPEDIDRVFRGMSKRIFKDAIGQMFRRGLIKRPEKERIELISS